MKANHLSTRLFWIVAILAAFPLAIFAVVSVRGSYSASGKIARAGLEETAHQLAGRMDEIILADIKLIQGLAEMLSRPGFSAEMTEALLDGYSLRFSELKRVGVADRKGTFLIRNDPAWSKLSDSVIRVLRNTRMGIPVISDLTWNDGFLPTVFILVSIDSARVLVAEMNIVRLWQIVEEISIGKTGKTLLFDRQGVLIAHGSMEGKKLILKQGEGVHLETSSAEYKNILGVDVVGASQPVRQLRWTVVVEQDASEIYAFSRTLTILLAVLFFTLAVAIIVIGSRASRVVTRPLEQLVAATQKVAKGDFGVSLLVQGTDERAQLTEAFNQMVRELGELHEEIAHRERMSVIGRIASELIHDLRHPVRNIENAAYLLNSRGNEPEVREMFERVTKREFEGLNRFLQNLEQLIVEPTLQSSEVDLVAEVQSLVETFRNSTEGAEIIWNTPASGTGYVVCTDRFLFRRILQNVLRNAMEATPPGKEIRISINQADPLEISVRDQGSGIPAEQLPKLFDELRTTKRRGLGLGLAICKKLIGQLGGTLQAANHPEGGAVFTIRLPRNVG